MKIATWNIGRFLQDREENAHRMRQILAADAPDVLCLQEFPFEEGEIADMGASFGLKEVFVKRCDVSHVAGGEMGIAVLSRYALREKNCFALPKPQGKFVYRGREETLHDKYFVSLSVGCERPLTLVTGHGFSFHRYGKDPAEFPALYAALDAWIYREAAGRSVVAGDFNLEDPSLLPNLAKTHTDVFFGEITRPNGRKTDYLYLSEGIRLKGTKNLPCGSYDPDLGFDHHYLCAEIE